MRRRAHLWMQITTNNMFLIFFLDALFLHPRFVYALLVRIIVHVCGCFNTYEVHPISHICI